MLHGPLAHNGYDWWWHSFTAQDAETGEDKPFFIEFFICNPALAEDSPILGQLPENKEAGKKPSYLMVKAGCWGEDHCQLHRFFSLRDTSMNKDTPYRVSAADCLATEDALRGSIDITYNGRKYIVSPEKSFGYADKNWGRDFTSPWVWLSSNCLKSRKTGEMLKNSVFDIGAGRQ